MKLMPTVREIVIDTESTGLDPLAVKARQS
jgi:hypothetical protein